MNNRQRFWFSLHGWISLPVWFLFAFVCLTGTICVVSHEITWLVNPAARATNIAGVQSKPLEELIAAAKAAAPGATVSHIISLEPYLVTAIRLQQNNKPPLIAYVNPYTAEVQELFSGMTFIEFMRSLHGWLLFPWQHRYSVGYYLVTALSLIMLGATITGMVIYKKFWRSFFHPRLRLAEGLRKAAGDLHRLIGSWSIWFLLIIGSTGAWYLTQALFWHNNIEIEKHPALLSSEELPSAVVPPKMISIAQAAAIAANQFGEFSPTWISTPEHNKGYFEIAGRGDGLFFDEYSYSVAINPWTGSVIQATDPSTMNLLQKISHLADPLHYGKIAGLTTKLIWFVFGILVSAMSISGFIIWIKRTTSAQRHSPPRWVYLINTALVLAPVWFLYTSFNPQFSKDWGEASIDSITATAAPLNDSQPYAEGDGYQKDFSFTFCQGCAAQIRVAYAKIGQESPTITDSPDGILHGHGDTLHAHVPTPKAPKESDKLWVIIQKWDGTIAKLFWQIQR